MPPNAAMAVEAERSEAARLVTPCCWMRGTHLGWETLSWAHPPHRQGYSSPPKGTQVVDRNAGTRIVCPERNWASRDGRRRTSHWDSSSKGETPCAGRLTAADLPVEHVPYCAPLLRSLVDSAVRDKDHQLAASSVSRIGCSRSSRTGTVTPQTSQNRL